MNHSQPRPRARSYTKKFTGCGLGVDCGVWPHKAAALDNKTKKQIERRTPTSKMIAGFLRQWISQLLCRRFLLENASDRRAVPAPGLSVDRDRICVGFTNIGGASINESTPVVNHPGIGIYLNPRVEIVRAAGESLGCGLARGLLPFAKAVKQERSQAREIQQRAKQECLQNPARPESRIDCVEAPRRHRVDIARFQDADAVPYRRLVNHSLNPIIEEHCQIENPSAVHGCPQPWDPVPVTRLNQQSRCFRCMSQCSGHSICRHRIHHGRSFSRNQPVRSGDAAMHAANERCDRWGNRRNSPQKTLKAREPA